MVKLILFSIFGIIFSGPVMAQSCFSDQFIFDYYGKYQCKLGGKPGVCDSLPRGALSVAAGGAGAYLGGKAGSSLGSRWGEKAALDEASIDNSIRTKALSKMGSLAKEWADFFAVIKKNPQATTADYAKLSSLTNETRQEFFEGVAPDKNQAKMQEEFLDVKKRLQTAVKGRVTPQEIANLESEVYDTLHAGRSYRLNKIMEKSEIHFRRAFDSRVKWGRRAGKAAGGLAGFVEAASDVVIQENKFNKCWKKNTVDVGYLKGFVDFNDSCEMSVKESRVQDLIDMFPHEREEFFKKCPECCTALTSHYEKVKSQIAKDSPLVAVNENDCTEEKMAADVTINGHTYRHTYKMIQGKTSLEASLIPGSDDLNSNNKLTIGVTPDGNFLNPNIRNMNGGQISSLMNSENIPRKLVSWYNDLKGKGTVPKEERDLADIEKVRFSVAEQIKAADLSYNSIRSFCSEVLKKNKKNSPVIPERSSKGLQ